MSKLTPREVLRDEIIGLRKLLKEKEKRWKQMNLEDCEVKK